MKKFVTTFTLISSAVLLAGCSSAADPSDTAAGSADTNPSAQQDTGANDGTFSIEKITSCDQVAEAVAPYIEGLVPLEGSNVSSTSVYCSWGSGEAGTDLSDIRGVDVTLTPTPEQPDFSMLLDMKGTEALADPWVAEQGGTAFAHTVDIGLVVTIGTTVWVPGVEVSIAGGKWDGVPSLDGPAGIEVAKALLTQ
ncbi:hypothetical protein ICL81_03210 [Leucobacter sp. cx-328]|uniref:hypothetical protein n=1 Tax=unclassified Leucobacter TaxID=2621730 RepID=UPI00165E5852|nr:MULTISPECIES: hypothetical protein [unclassified Leucobacter]MBC9943537.1 hypothetical protein [Leucobacter sp. cx-328]MBC9954164.1 hypothetical protein [Leucobacter sp. cx-42]